jgi:dTDP-4-amino-4,6-dideoxygalactose transaminase
VRGSFPEAERAADEVLSLPMFPELKSEQIERVAEAISEFFGPK